MSLSCTNGWMLPDMEIDGSIERQQMNMEWHFLYPSAATYMHIALIKN